jgi:hypothetical protein
MKSVVESEEWAAKTAPKRWTTRRKAVLRLLRGERLDELSRQWQVPAHRLAQWRDLFLVAGGLKSRSTTPAEEALKKAQAKIGELTLKLELYEKKDALLARARRSKRS